MGVAFRPPGWAKAHAHRGDARGTPPPTQVTEALPTNAPAVPGAILAGVMNTVDSVSAARLQAENEALRFECDLLRREAGWLVAVNRMLEASLALAEGERERLVRHLRAIEHSRAWRLLQTVRAWVGRRW